MKTLLLDNYDSFSHILYQYLWEVNGERPHFVRNDEWTLDRIRSEAFDNILLSPGPGRPDRPGDFGVCGEVIRHFAGTPMLGVCLGHQGLGLFGGAAVVPAPAVRHGKPSRILHDGQGLFAGLPQGFEAVRYHSLVVAGDGLPAGLEVTATSEDDGQIMGLRLTSRPCYGVQFHPESIGTAHGKALLVNFRRLTEEWKGMGAAVLPGEVLGRRQGIPPADINPLEPPSPRLPKPRLPAAHLELPWVDPEAAYHTLFAAEPAAFWLDAPAPPVPGETRASYMGSGRLLHEVRGATLKTWDPSHPAAAEVEGRPGDAFALLQAILNSLPDADLPFAFRGGLVGWFGYGLKRHAGGGDLPDTPPSDLPDAMFLEPTRFLRFDPSKRKVVAHLRPGAGAEDLAWLHALPGRFSALALPGGPAPLDLRRTGPDPRSFSGFRTPWTLSAPKARYLASIHSLQRAIREGETYEACLTNEIQVRADEDPWAVYRLLRRTNPAPYAAYLRFPGLTLLSSSPERFLRLEACAADPANPANPDPGFRLSSRPIKGTRPRGDTPAEDASIRESLASHPKDRSENLMIVDLMRNDFGKVCALGTVKVPESMVVEEHPTVFQLVSEVEGRLLPGIPSLEAVRACFPGGSMTGAPKKRTMELLETQEGRDRGVFSGALGWLGADGALDLGMVIRTLVHRNGEYRIGCGGAILAESDPEGEFAEALLKAYAPLRALELARYRQGGGWAVGG